MNWLILKRLGKTCLQWINLRYVCKELFGNTFESLTFLKSQGISTDSLVARIILIVGNNEQLLFNPVFSTYLNNNPVTLFPFVFLKSQKVHIRVPHHIDWTVYDLMTFTDHYDPNLHLVVACFINYEVCWIKNHYFEGLILFSQDT